ncbi:hypothetical protein NB713_001724 [Xanthomonas sacchari]|nr:hypothetical protein [Xanthomonas sacchari]
MRWKPGGSLASSSELRCCSLSACIQDVRGRPYPHPNPLPRGEGLWLLPSPSGRRCPAGADEGPGVASHGQFGAGAARPGPSPQPLSRRERGFGCSLLPPGEGAPQGRMRVRAEPRMTSLAQALRAPYPYPNRSPGGRGFGCSLLLPGEGAPQGRMRVRASPRMARLVQALRARTLTPPLPRGEGLWLLPSPSGRRCPAGAGEGPGVASHGQIGAGAARPVPSPQPLSRRERGFGCSLLPPGEGAPQGRMRVRA